MLSFRQGDVLIRQVVSFDTYEVGEAVARENGAVILAYGEKTGHSHAIAERDVTMYLPANATEVKLLDVKKPVTLCHDEHNPITIPEGLYEVWIQVEYTPQGLQQVYD
jgi:hypothetical protein